MEEDDFDEPGNIVLQEEEWNGQERVFTVSSRLLTDYTVKLVDLCIVLFFMVVTGRHDRAEVLPSYERGRHAYCS